HKSRVRDLTQEMCPANIKPLEDKPVIPAASANQSTALVYVGKPSVVGNVKSFADRLKEVFETFFLRRSGKDSALSRASKAQVPRQKANISSPKSTALISRDKIHMLYPDTSPSGMMLTEVPPEFDLAVDEKSWWSILSDPTQNKGESMLNGAWKGAKSLFEAIDHKADQVEAVAKFPIKVVYKILEGGVRSWFN
ncbi:MAG: hypothetical protein JXA94_03585, partial [Parachlamydiales bacterium]|nr:hypothetical protein [Parachlamydiales bacterium]